MPHVEKSISKQAVASTRRRRRRGLRRIGAAIVLLALLLIADYWAYPYGTHLGGRSLNTGENGLWLRYTWYFGQHSDADLRRLAQQLGERQIRYAYFHVRGITRAGTLAYRYPDRARHLIALMHREVPSVKVIAWVYAGNRRGAGEVDLSNPRVRQAMVGEAVWLVTAGGFDGVQWDYEICDNADPDFLNLMHETRAALPQGKLLSTATPLWLPRPLLRWGWSEDYFRQVAATCDQIAVMCYDSGFYLPRSYVWLVRQQAIHVTQAVARSNLRCRVLLGIPTYERGFFSHNPHAGKYRPGAARRARGAIPSQRQPLCLGGRRALGRLHHRRQRMGDISHPLAGALIALFCYGEAVETFGEGEGDFGVAEGEAFQVRDLSAEGGGARFPVGQDSGDARGDLLRVEAAPVLQRVGQAQVAHQVFHFGIVGEREGRHAHAGRENERVQAHGDDRLHPPDQS